MVLLERDLRLSLALEEVVREVILADPSDYGIDLAVAKIFTSYHLSTQKWEPLQYPNARWFTSKTTSVRDQPSQTVHINVVSGSLRVDGQSLGGLLHEIRDTSEYRRIFHLSRAGISRAGISCVGISRGF